MVIDDKMKAKSVVKKIRNCTGVSPEERLFFAVFEQVVRDLFINTDTNMYRNSAKRYMNGEMPHLQKLGIDPEYVHRLFKQSGIDHMYR